MKGYGRYDTRRKVWIDMEPMSGGARYAHAVCSLRDQVYVAGGHLHRFLLLSISTCCSCRAPRVLLTVLAALLTPASFTMLEMSGGRSELRCFSPGRNTLALPYSYSYSSPAPLSSPPPVLLLLSSFSSPPPVVPHGPLKPQVRLRNAGGRRETLRHWRRNNRRGGL